MIVRFLRTHTGYIRKEDVLAAFREPPEDQDADDAEDAESSELGSIYEASSSNSSLEDDAEVDQTASYSPLPPNDGTCTSREVAGVSQLPVSSLLSRPLYWLFSSASIRLVRAAFCAIISSLSAPTDPWICFVDCSTSSVST
jgi:hypothetical protein